MEIQYLLSIITINLNNNEGLQKTIQSIEQQRFSHHEHIIIDGGSTDKSKETIIQYAARTSHLSYWISEKDSGIYNAMNKGIVQANGEYLLFLNSGDYLEPNILEQIKDQITGEDIIYGDLYFVSQIGVRRFQTFNGLNLSTTTIILPTFCIPHPASLIKKSLFEHERYSEHYKIVSDWEFFVKNIILKNCTTKHIPLGISNFTDGGVSSIDENKALIIQEREAVLHQLFPPKILESLNKLVTIERTPLCDILLQGSCSNSFLRKIKRIICVYIKIRAFFHKLSH